MQSLITAPYLKQLTFRIVKAFFLLLDVKISILHQPPRRNRELLMQPSKIKEMGSLKLQKQQPFQNQRVFQRSLHMISPNLSKPLF